MYETVCEQLTRLQELDVAFDAEITSGGSGGTSGGGGGGERVGPPPPGGPVVLPAPVRFIRINSRSSTTARCCKAWGP